jgi:hypothetical protein
VDEESFYMKKTFSDELMAAKRSKRNLNECF